MLILIDNIEDTIPYSGFFVKVSATEFISWFAMVNAIMYINTAHNKKVHSVTPLGELFYKMDLNSRNQGAFFARWCIHIFTDISKFFEKIVEELTRGSNSPTVPKG